MFSIFLTVYRLASCWTVDMVQQLYEQNICVIDQAVVRSSLLDIRQVFLRFFWTETSRKEWKHRRLTQAVLPAQVANQTSGFGSSYRSHSQPYNKACSNKGD